MTRRTGPALLLVGLALISISSATRAAAPAWTRAATAHFEVHTTAGARTAMDILTYFEQVRGFFEAFLALPPSSRSPVQVIAFASDEEFAPYRMAPTASAYFQPSHERDFIVLRKVDGDSEPILVHEYAHLALERGGGQYPPWLSEGLAEFFSTMVPDRRRVVLGRPPVGRLATLRREALLPVSRVLAVTRDAAEYTADHAGLFYAESWALTHMLVAGERYQPQVDRLLALIARGAPAVDALATVYQKSPAEIEADLRQYIARGFYRQLTVPYAPVAPDLSTAKIGPEDTFDAQLTLAHLLAAGRGREERARDAFESLARERPDDGRLAGARGLFELQTGHPSDARTWLERAITAGSRDALAHAELARLVESTDAARASALLATAAALAPDDPEVRLRSAAHLVTLRRGADALAELGRINPVPASQRFVYYQVIANAQALLGHFDQARAAAARVADFATTAEESRFAVDLMSKVRGPADMTHVVLGRLRRMDCAGPSPVLEVHTADGVLRLLLEDPSKVLIGGGTPIDLDCGQQDRPLRIGYAAADAPPGTNGRVRFIDFRSSTWGQAGT